MRVFSRQVFIAASILLLQTSPGYSAVTKKKSASKERPSSRLKLRHSFTSTGKRRAQKFRLKAINDIRSLLKDTKDDSKRYELMRRLGELYVEQAEYSYEIEIAKYEAAWKSWEKKGSPKGKEPKMDNLISHKSRKQAVKIYMHIVSKFKSYPQVDISYFELGKTYLRLNDDKGIKYLKLLLAEHPKSVLVPETYLALGERYFDKHDVKNAKYNYQQALKFKEHQIYPYVVYKLGWTHYNSEAKSNQDENKNLKRTLAAFKLVVKLSDQRKGKPGGSSLFLRQEAINDLVVVYADLGDVDGAYKYFRSIGSEDSFYQMLERLGGIYTEQGKYKLAIKVYRRLLKDASLRESSPSSHAKLVDLHDRIGSVGGLRSEIKKMTKLYLPGGPWYKKYINAADKSLAIGGRDKVESTIHRYSKLYHQRGQKQKSKDHFRVAAVLYQLFLKNFPKSKDSYELRYLLADSLYEMKEYDKAATQYLKVVAMNRKNGSYLHKAALSAVDCMTNVIAATKYDEIPPAGSLKKPITLPKTKVKFVKTLDTYVKLFPKKKDSRRMFLTSARTFYDYGHYKKAIRRFVEITEKIPGTPQADESVGRTLNHFEDRKDWDTVIVYTKKFLNQKKLLKKDLRKKTEKLLVDASFARAVNFTKERKYEKGANAFVAFQKDFPKHKNAPNALYNAMVNYFRHGEAKPALAAGRALLQRYPEFNRNQETVIALADTYQNLATFDLAASYYALYAKSWPKDKKAPAAMFSSAILYKGSDKSTEALKLFNLFVRTYPKHDLCKQAYLEMAEIHENSNNIGQAIALYKIIGNQFARKFPNDAVLANAKVAVFNYKKSPNANTEKQLGSLVRTLVRKNAPSAPKARQVIAEVYFQKIDPAFQQYKKTPIDVSKGIEKGIAAKQAVLVRLAKEYESIIDLANGDYTIASFYRLGEAHEVLAKAMTTIKLPATLSQEEVAAVNKQLADAAKPLADQGYQYLEAAYKQANSAQVFSPWVQTVHSKMALLKPEKIHKVREFQVEPGYMTHSLDYDQSVASTFD